MLTQGKLGHYNWADFQGWKNKLMRLNDLKKIRCGEGSYTQRTLEDLCWSLRQDAHRCRHPPFPKGPGLPPGWREEEEKEDLEAPQNTERLWLGDCPVFRTSWELPLKLSCAEQRVPQKESIEEQPVTSPGARGLAPGYLFWPSPSRHTPPPATGVQRGHWGFWGPSCSCWVVPSLLGPPDRPVLRPQEVGLRSGTSLGGAPVLSSSNSGHTNKNPEHPGSLQNNMGPESQHSGKGICISHGRPRFNPQLSTWSPEPARNDLWVQNQE